MQLNSSRVIGLCLLVAACGGWSGTPPKPPPPQPLLVFEYRAPAAVSDGTSSSAGRVWVAAYKNPPQSWVAVYDDLREGMFSLALGEVPTVGTYTLKDAVFPTEAAWYRADAPADNPEFGIYVWDAIRSGSTGTAVLTLTEVSPEAVHGTIHFAEKNTLDATF
jgi:hypothetical protein